MDAPNHTRISAALGISTSCTTRRLIDLVLPDLFSSLALRRPNSGAAGSASGSGGMTDSGGLLSGLDCLFTTLHELLKRPTDYSGRIGMAKRAKSHLPVFASSPHRSRRRTTPHRGL